MPKTFVKKPCEVCQQPLSPQGRPAHFRSKHPNYDLAGKLKKQPVSISEARVKLDMELGEFLGLVKRMQTAA